MIYGGKAISNKYVFSFCLRKVSIVFGDLIVIWSLFQIVVATPEKARLPQLSFVLGTKSCLETDDLKGSCRYITEM